MGSVQRESMTALKSDRRRARRRAVKVPRSREARVESPATFSDRKNRKKRKLLSEKRKFHNAHPLRVIV